ncbi:hypothetical protein MTO96_050482 [Rhipicephalus appendiculatus]
MALEESGLLEKAMKSQFSRKPTSSHVPFDVPFTDYAIVYAIGCSLSTLVFCIEVFLHSRAQLQRRRHGNKNERVINFKTSRKRVRRKCHHTQTSLSRREGCAQPLPPERLPGVERDVTPPGFIP